MSEGRYQKKFRLKYTDEDWINKIFEMRDKITYPTEGSYFTHILRIYDNSEEGKNIESMDKELNNICSAGELIKSDRFFVCSRGGTIALHKDIFKRKKLYAFKIGRDAISLDSVKRICDNCYINSDGYKHHIWQQKQNIIRAKEYELHLKEQRRLKYKRDKTP